MSLYRAEGVVLRTTKLGEADRIITFATKERGKVRAVAKGVRKTKSRFGGRVEPIGHVSLQLYEGRELDIVTQVESIDVFSNIRKDLDRARRALSMLEAVDQVMQEAEANVSLFKMLTGALRSLDANDSPVIVGAFFWKLLSLEGVRPMLDACASCSREQVPLVAFDLAQGGALCGLCRTGVPISEPALALMKRVLGGDLARVLAEAPSAAGYELEHLADQSMEAHLERRLRSRHLLDKA